MFRFSKALPLVRRAAGVGAVAATAAFTVAACDGFDAKGFETKITFPNSNAPLSLAGVGMRRKNLYIMEVDVYLVGFYMGEEAIAAANAWKAASD